MIVTLSMTLTIVFVALKFFSIINWEWIWVLSPLWIIAILWLIRLVVVLIFIHNLGDELDINQIKVGDYSNNGEDSEHA